MYGRKDPARMARHKTLKKNIFNMMKNKIIINIRSYEKTTTINV